MDHKKRELKESSFRGADLKLFVRDVRDRQGRKRPITVRSWSTIKDIKDAIQQTIHIPASSQRLFFGPLMTSGKELPNHRTLHDAGIYRSGETLLLDIKMGGSSFPSIGSIKKEARNNVSISSSVVDLAPKLLRQTVQQARRALALGLKPEFILDGSGGTYYLHDARKAKIAIFKPADEEPYAENNPRGYLPQPGESIYLREGVVPGEACIREVAAFMMDHGGFSNVPMTTLVEAHHPSFNTNGARLNVSQGGASIGAHSISTGATISPVQVKKVGSFQEFVRAECTMDDISPSMISVDEVHKIAILDIRLMNADRNSANLLCKRRSDNSFQLVPIDHGFCLRSVADVSWMDWCWLDWPQMKQPLSQRTKDYILSLNIEEDARLLHETLNIQREALDYFCASSSILKAGIRAGLTLYDIAVMCCRNDNLGEAPSKLEALMSMAADLAESAIENGRWHHAAASRALAEQLSPNAGSLLQADPTLPIKKSASAIHMNQLDKTFSDPEGISGQEITPGMVQSSASDSSSDSGEIDHDDCEEWAAALVADVSLERSYSLMNTTKQDRSNSIESHDSHDSSEEFSPKGFWHTRPSDFSEKSSSDEDDDGDSWISWGSADEPEEASLPTLSSPIPTSHDGEERDFQKMRSPTKVSFNTTVEHTKAKETFEASFKHSNSDVNKDSKPTYFQLPENSGAIRRSQSYSALSTISMHQKVSFNEDNVNQLSRPFIKAQEQYRDYFLKFVDLVIVRETTAASLSAKHAE